MLCSFELRTFSSTQDVSSVQLCVEKFFFCLTGPYLTRRATIGRLADPPLAEGGSLDPPYEPPPQV